jgi:hypothetical protein
LIGWAAVKALREFPGINHAYAEKDGQPYRVARTQINLGVAVDVAGKDGARSLLVPNIKDAGGLNFQEYVTRFDDLVARARAGKLTTEDFQGTTISLTNPGTVGTMSSNPRLLTGQGAIIAAGAIDYPAEYQGAADETRALLGISKVMTLNCTYDHRIIQGAESGLFLGKVQDAASTGALGERQAAQVTGNGDAHRGDCEAGGDYSADQRLSRARASDRGFRPAGFGAQLPSGTRSGDVRVDDLGPGPRVSDGNAGRSDWR